MKRTRLVLRISLRKAEQLGLFGHLPSSHAGPKKVVHVKPHVRHTEHGATLVGAHDRVVVAATPEPVKPEPTPARVGPVTLTTLDAARMLWGATSVASVMPDRARIDHDTGRWFYEDRSGARYPVRALTGAELVTYDPETGVFSDTDGGWIADRFGRAGARQRVAMKQKLQDASGLSVSGAVDTQRAEP